MPTMTRAVLLPCPACARHIRVDSGACPFCARGLSASFDGPKSPRLPRPTRRTETLVYLAGTSALALAAAACGGIATNTDADSGDGATIADSAIVDGTLGDHFVGNTYGGPPPFDAAPRDSLTEGAHSDAESGDEGGPFEAGQPVDAKPFACDACAFGCCPSLPDMCCPAPPYGSPPPPDAHFH
jgi:hypothetical protein